MAQQAILAGHARRRRAAATDSTFDSPEMRDVKPQVLSLKKALVQNKQKLFQLFTLWDEDNSGSIDGIEFRRGCKMLNLRPGAQELADFFDLIDRDGSGTIDLDELNQLLNAPEDINGEEEAVRTPNVLRRLISFIYWLINTTTMQTALYFAFVIVFQSLTDSLRLKEEYFVDKYITETLLNNHFDSSHNTFLSIRRIADIYEWGNTVLWPGLLGNAGPACGDVGLPGVLESPNPFLNQSMEWKNGSSEARVFKGGCNDDAWPDGEGTFATVNATAWTVAEQVARMNEFDWTEGIQFRLVRVQSENESTCKTVTIGGLCYPELAASWAQQNQSAYGYNWTAPTKPLTHPFRWFSSQEMGGNPEGQGSAHQASFRLVPSGGFIALVVPFFSDTMLDDQRLPADEVFDFRKTRADRNNNRVPRYFCVRLSWNGDMVHQLCDPNDVDGRTTGVVRAAIEEMWNDLKRSHWIDESTRAIVMTLPVVANNVGARSRASFIFELVSTGAVLTSYDIETRIIREDMLQATRFLGWIATGFTVFFCFLEGVEISNEGLPAYFSNMWNVMDWLNFCLFGLVWWYLLTMLYQDKNPSCAPLCESIGYQDDWEVMDTASNAKTFLSMCVCIQLFKVIKFVSTLVPKMDLAPSVLAKALPDLVLFGVVFGIVVNAFSNMFYVQLGPVMVEYNDQTTSFISVSRALFGDFDIEDIIDNSRGYLNASFFLIFLFVTVFVMLSMFFSILGEAQANLRDDQRKLVDAPPEYGIFHTALESSIKGAKHLPVIGDRIRLKEQKLAEKNEAGAQEVQPVAAVDRIEARQLELVDKIAALSKQFDSSSPGLVSLQQQSDQLSPNSELLSALADMQKQLKSVVEGQKRMSTELLAERRRRKKQEHDKGEKVECEQGVIQGHHEPSVKCAPRRSVRKSTSETHAIASSSQGKLLADDLAA